MDNIHETNYSEKLLSNYHPNDNPSYPVPLFLCLPLATPDDSKNATPPSHGTDGSHADGTSGHPPDASSPGRKNKITEAFFTCLKAHNGNVVWNHPVETCNTCRCLPGGGVSCTKKLCSTVTNNAASEGAENSKAPMAEIAV
ncbi:hypothetical protein LPJ74_000530 [Coemansia sp. RSA 1843]|nr:hypothetical protein LPJ74_000530 [Coemansia sp. RSA 1843]